MTTTTTVPLADIITADYFRAQSNNYTGELYTALQRYAKKWDRDEIRHALDEKYLTIDRLCKYVHPQTGRLQQGMVLGFDRAKRTAAINQAAQVGDKVAVYVAAIYNELSNTPNYPVLLRAMSTIKAMDAAASLEELQAYCEEHCYSTADN